MKGVAALWRHDLATQRPLLLASLALGGIPLLLWWRAAAAPAAAQADRHGAVVVLALLLGGVTALLLGATAIVSDLVERRLGFYFARPLGAWAIWAGKLGSAVLAAWAAGLAVLLPDLLVTAVVGGGGDGGGGLAAARDLLLPPLASGALLVPLVVLAAHIGSLILRVRSAWFFLDTAVVAILGVAGAAIVFELGHWGVLLVVGHPLQLVQAGSEAAAAYGFALVAGAAVSAASVVGGRTDAARSHRLASLTLAGCGTAGLLVLGMAAWHWLAIGPADLERWTLARAAPGEGWIAVAGPAPGPPGYRAAFFVQRRTGRSVRARFALGSGLNLPLAFSADGRRAVWVEYDAMRLTSFAVLMRLDLDRPGAEPQRTGIGPVSVLDEVVLSPDGSRVAITGDSRTRVLDLASGRLLAAPAMPAHGYGYARFLDRDHLRMLAMSLDDRQEPPGRYLDVLDLDLPTRHLTARAHLRLPWKIDGVSPDARRLLAGAAGSVGSVGSTGAAGAAGADGAGGSAVELIDAEAGRLLVTLRQSGAAVHAFFLADGRIAERLVDAEGTRLLLLDRDGRPGGADAPLPAQVRFPAGATIGPVYLAAGDRLVVRVRRTAPDGARVASWWVADLHTGIARRLGGEAGEVAKAGGAGGTSARGAADGREETVEAEEVGQLVTPLAGRALGDRPLFVVGQHFQRIDLASGRREILGRGPAPRGAGFSR